MTIAAVVLIGWCGLSIATATLWSAIRHATARTEFDRHVADALALQDAARTWTDLELQAHIAAWKQDMR